MSLISIALITCGVLIAIAAIPICSNLAMRGLRTVPKPPKLAPETLQLFPAETRAGIRLHQACYNNDAQVASEALVLWAWASGETAVANVLDWKRVELAKPELHRAINDLWCHLEAPEGRHWFGDSLWNAFVGTNPEFQDLEFIG